VKKNLKFSPNLTILETNQHYLAKAALTHQKIFYDFQSCFELQNGDWSRTFSLSIPRYGASVARSPGKNDSKILITGGLFNEFTAINTSEILTETGWVQWEQDLPPEVWNRAVTCAFFLNNSAMMLLVDNGTFTFDFEVRAFSVIVYDDGRLADFNFPLLHVHS